jgi:hypothetical protein
MATVAVMQPYFMPYAGYFRLFCAADVFVMFDCVQFRRRGWVHRNRFPLLCHAPRPAQPRGVHTLPAENLGQQDTDQLRPFFPAVRRAAVRVPL